MKHKHLSKTLQYLWETALAVIVFSVFLFFMPSKDEHVKTESNQIQFVFHESAEGWEEIFEEHELDDVLTWELKDEVIAWLDGWKDVAPPPTLPKKSCFVPWIRQNIDHGDYVLAYQQRSDVPTVCNVQRRLCNDGLLLGSYTQRACQENITYQYTETPVISYNTKTLSSLIQPTPPPYENARFGMDGKRYVPTKQTTYRNNSVNTANIGNPSGNGQLSTDGEDCRAPWWEVVKNRQFVRAYKSAFWFTNAACEVELRYCLDGELNGSFYYKYCEHMDMSWEDYILQSQDETESYQGNTIFQLINGL